MEKETVVYTYAMQYYFTSTKEILQFVTWMNLEDIRLSEISQAQGKEKNKTKLRDLTYMWNLKKSNTQKQRVEPWLPRAGRWENWRDVGQSV